MKVTVQQLFEKDIHKINNRKLAIQVSNAIENMEFTTNLSDLRNIKKISHDLITTKNHKNYITVLLFK